jgi:hypothetical protein
MMRPSSKSVAGAIGDVCLSTLSAIKSSLQKALPGAVAPGTRKGKSGENSLPDYPKFLHEI